MSAFLLPKWTMQKIDQIRRRFLWHGHKDQHAQLRSLYMVNWDLATRPRDQGGLGVRNIQLVNHTLLMRWMWQWSEDQNAWWTKSTSISAQNDRPWNTPGNTAFWRSINHLQAAFNSSVQYEVGTGETVSFWHDNWYGSPMKYLYPSLFHLEQDKQISVSYYRQNHDWLRQFTSLTHEGQAEKDRLLHSLHELQITAEHDKIKWLRHPQTFSVKSAYHFLSHRPSPNSPIGKIWRLKAPLRVTVFAWLLLNNRLTTIDNLARRGWHLPNMCQMCRAQEETASHLFQKCPLAMEIRNYMCTLFPNTIPQKYCTLLSFDLLLNPAENPVAAQWEITTCFVLWRERCRRIFSEKDQQPVPLVREIRLEWRDWFQ